MASSNNVPTSITQDGVVEKQPVTDEEMKEVGADETGSTHKQEGVRQVEAIVSVWSRQVLIVMFVLLYLVTFVDALLQVVQSSLIPYVTSSFSRHGLLAATSVIATIVGGVIALPIAKVIDIWGRCEGFIIMVCLLILGLILKAVSHLFGSIGASVGLAIAGALWTNTLPAKLYEFLPEDFKDKTGEIFGSIIVQRSFPMGTPVRDAIIAAYADVQRKMVISGAAFLPLCLICLLLWKNINVKTLEETRGTQSKGNLF